MAWVKIADITADGATTVTVQLTYTGTLLPYRLAASGDATGTMASTAGIVVETEVPFYIDITDQVFTDIVIEGNGGSVTSVDLSNANFLTLTILTIVSNALLADSVILPEFSGTLLGVDFSGNALDTATQDAIILAVWNNAIRKQQLSKTFNILSNDGTYSAQSAAYLTALNDNATFKWVINTVNPTGTGFTNIDSVEDLQTLAVNKTVAAVQTKDIDASVTHQWGINKPTYQLITFATNTDITTPNTGTLAARIAAITNGNITFGATTYQVCGVYFDNSQTLKGFYVNSTTELTGDIAQSTTFASATYTCTPVNHYYRDIAVPAVYASEKLKFGVITDGTIPTKYNLTVDGNERIVGYCDGLNRIYYMGQTKQSTDGQAKTGFVPIGTVAAPFTGSYNCQGYKISNLYVNCNAQGVGMFGRMSGNAGGYAFDSIRLKDDVIIAFGNTSATDGRVGMVGSIETSRILKDSYNTGSINGTGCISYFTGGLVGYSKTTCQVYNSYNTGKVNSVGNGFVFTGGIVGYNTTNCQVYNTYNIGDISSTAYNANTRCAGLVGYNLANSLVYNSFGYGSILGYRNGVALEVKAIYLQDATSSSFNVYQLGETGTGGLTAAQFKNKSNFATVTANYTGLAGVITYSTTVTYLVGTRTLLSGVYYICIQEALNKAPATETTYWTAIPAVAWDDETNYTTGTFHIFGGKLYYCYTDANTGIEPGVTADWEDYWNDLTYHDEVVLAYANTGRVITTDGKCYVCIQAAPIGTAITNTAYWLEDTGFNFNTIWRMGNLYPELMQFYIATYNFFKQNFGSSNFIFKQRG